jgi:catechol 2,3-dioxygenase-like lactoylglutathione lyase family enzyme
VAVTRIARISLTTADPDGLEVFYRSGLGFERIGVEAHGGQPFARLTAVAHAEAHVLVLSLGEQILELVAFSEPGKPYPYHSASNDPRFQHFAIVVASMEAAYARLVECRGWTPITAPAPQRLPASSGGVVAFKFRDPEGHPVELLEFPAGNAPPAWQAARPAVAQRGADPCLGIDHSAIVVASTERSVDFYEGLLGFSILGRSFNRGPEQERLDGLPNAIVEVTALGVAGGAPPHLELLCYRSPASHGALRAPPGIDDVAATRLTLETEDLASVALRLKEAGVPLMSSGVTPLQGRPAVSVRDPDGHALWLLERSGTAAHDAHR